MPAVTNNTRTLQNYRTEIGTFDTTTQTNDSIIARQLAAGKNSSSPNPGGRFKQHEGTAIHRLTHAGTAANSYLQPPAPLKVNNLLQLASVLLHAGSLWSPASVGNQLSALDIASNQRGTSTLGADGRETAVASAAEPGSWADLGLSDPLQFPAARASPIGHTPFEAGTNVIEDLLALANGHHEIHANAIEISRAATNPERAEVIRALLANKNIPVKVQIFSPSFGPGPLQACKNFIVDLPGPASDQPEKLIILTAHYDKIGVGSDGFYDNAVSCAALVDLAGEFQNDLPPGTRVQIVFLDAEEQGLMGSRAFVKSLQIDKVTPDLIVNLDLMGGSGKEVYVGASNSSHAGWPFAEDRASARAPKRTQKNEAHFINLLRQEAQDFNIVQNSGTPYSDHLAAQFEGLQAIGISVVKPGEPQQTELYENAFTEFAAANVDWAVIDRIHNNTDEGAPEYKYASQRLQAANLRWIDAMSALQHASDNYGTGKRLHNDQDNEDLFHSGNANQFSRILKTVVDRFLAPAAV